MSATSSAVRASNIKSCSSFIMSRLGQQQQTTIQKRARVSRQLRRDRKSHQVGIGEDIRTNTHKHALTANTLHRDNLFVVSFIVGAKFNTYDLYMNFDIDYFAFQHFQLKISISCVFSHIYTCTFTHTHVHVKHGEVSFHAFDCLHSFF